MKCPSCGSKNTRVYDTKPQGDGSVLRRRMCRGCGFKFKTLEEQAKLARISAIVVRPPLLEPYM